jgi:hypothetical protein
MYWRNITLVSIWNVFQHEGFYRLAWLMTPAVDCLNSSLEGVKTFACIRGCLTSIPESSISVNISWGFCPSRGCYRQRITNWCYGRFGAHEGQFQRTSKHLISFKGTSDLGLQSFVLNGAMMVTIWGGTLTVNWIPLLKILARWVKIPSLREGWAHQVFITQWDATGCATASGQSTILTSSALRIECFCGLYV